MLGWERALKRHGTITLAQALAPAVEVARQGFVVDATFASQIQENLDYFDDVPAAAALYLDPDGTPRDVGTVFRNPDLARTYRLIAREGSRGFYRGALASAITATVRSPQVSPAANHRLPARRDDAADLRAYTAPEREPVHSTYRGLDVYGMGPPSSGGLTIAEALNILEGYDLRGDDARRRPAPRARGVAARLRRPRRVHRRPPLLRGPARSACSPRTSPRRAAR